MPNGDLGYFTSTVLSGYSGITWSTVGNYRILTIDWSSVGLGSFFGTSYKSRRFKIGNFESLECIDGGWTEVPDVFTGDLIWSCQEGSTVKQTQVRDEVDYYLTIVDPRIAPFPNMGTECISPAGTDFTVGGITNGAYDAGGAWSIEFENGYTATRTSQSLSGDTYRINRSGVSAGNVNARIVWNFTSAEWDNLSSNWTYDYPIDGTYSSIGSFRTPPSVNAGGNVAYCEDTGNKTISGIPSGGSWSGPYISTSGVFNTNSASVGNHVVTYTITDGNGCSNSDTKTIVVESAPTVSSSNYSFCENDGVKSVSGSPTGGTWSGSGVTASGDFDTSIGDGNYTLTYSYTNGSGCTATSNSIVTVNAQPSVSAGNNQSACINDGSIALSGASPSGGSWSGSNVSGSTFNVSSAGVGTQSVTYTYTNSNGCTNSDAKNITIDDITTVKLCVAKRNFVKIQDYGI
ncbi:MAG: hypothetical protein U5K27_04625 [Desulfotignum sp.]|nr:hypothetical protein [Desulfotignum sp.]